MSDVAAPVGREPLRPASLVPREQSIACPLLLIGLLFGLHSTMVIWRGLNGDEFWYYSQVETVARGEWIQPLQTIHTRALFWLAWLDGTEIDHLIIARTLMMLCLAAIAGAIYATAEFFTDRRTALLAVAAYLGAGFVLQHGTSFRVDPIVTALLATGLAIVARTRLDWRAIFALGVVIGLAGMVTIKMVLWLPVFAGIALWRWHDTEFSRTYPLRWAAAAITAAAVSAGIYALHSSGASPDANASAASTVASAGSKMFGLFHSPYLSLMTKAALISIPLTIAALIVPWTVFRLDLPRGKRIALLMIWSPLLTPLFYHNSAPYVYVFLLSPVAIVSAFGLRVLTARYGYALVAGVIAANALAVWAVDERDVLPVQETTVDAVHSIFPEPVSYFDCCGMIGSFKQKNPFMTRWGTEQYLARDSAEYLEAMSQEPVPLLLDNLGDFTPIFDGGDERKLHSRDAHALKQTYVNFWGDIYLAGRDVPAGATLEWNVLVPGTYTVQGALAIDGKAYRDGAHVELRRNKVAIANTSDADARLLWGVDPVAPAGEPTRTEWTGF